MGLQSLNPQVWIATCLFYSPDPTQSNSCVARADAFIQRMQAPAYDNAILGAIRCLVTVYDTDVRTQ